MFQKLHAINMHFSKLCAWLCLFTFVCCAFCDENPLIFSTNECQLTEPVYGHKFDFRILQSDFAYIALSAKGHTFVYNVCGNLTRSCDGRNNVAACLKKDNKEYVLGTQHQLNYRNGKMYFSYTGGANCTSAGGSGKFQLHVFVGCDYTLDKNQSQVTEYADDACSFYITLETPYACLPEPNAAKTNTCNVKDPHTGHTYDLLPLSDVNYRTTDRMGSAFVINICKPVLYGENAMCPPGSSICFIALKSTDFKKKFYDYGTVETNPVIENGRLLLRHTSKTPCNTTDNYSSVVYFYCDKLVRNPHPELIGFHGCVYEFSFVTPLACNDLPPCTAITQGNEIINMTALMDHPFTLKSLSGQYTFDVCAPAGAPCLDHDGACLTLDGQTTSVGVYNSHLRFNQNGAPYLLYEGGATCQMPNSTTSSGAATTLWSTKIEFICANNGTKDYSANATATVANAELGPKIVEATNCQLLIHYQTALACHEQITCKAKVYVEHSEDGTGVELVDLTPLINPYANYEAKIDTLSSSEQQIEKSTKFFLNVCRPLVPKYHLGCAGGSAACMAKIDAASNPIEEQSLGSPLASLVAINRTAAELRYLRGGVCATDKDAQLSSGILFTCDRHAGIGTPVLQSVADCHYQFNWATNVLCPPHMCTFNADTCEINNDEINASYNLKTAPFTAAGKIKYTKDNAEFTIDVCGAHRKPVTDYADGLVNIFFTAAGPCGVNGVVNVQVRLICSSDTEYATSFSDDKQCNLLYIQRTPDICKFLGLAVPPKTTTVLPAATAAPTTKQSAQLNVADTASKTTKPKLLTTTTTTTTAQAAGNDNGAPHAAESTASVGAILGAILSLTFFVACFGILAFSPERRNALRRCFRRSTSAVRYSRVQSNEEANLLMEPNGEFTDSDDDMLL